MEEPIFIDSKKDFLQKRKSLKLEKGVQWAVCGDIIVMNKNFDKDLDFFSITRLNSSTYVSERLKNAIVGHGLTGWDFTPADKLIVEN